MKNIFENQTTEEIINRIHQLKPDTQAKWGKMNVAQMLAHCNVTYELIYEDKHKKPNAFMKFTLKMFVKKLVVNEGPYKPNNPTAPVFIIKDQKNFEPEKQRLIDHLTKTQQLGEVHFDNKESHSFGVLTKQEWNNMFYKHLDHHLNQFGV
ncbi:MAG: DUF1569 domain-containing protein [Pyrinomonadaceae bacterium]|nr:DUF1569 domain-containing protein [Sphingobacteriaceae bacterium]